MSCEHVVGLVGLLFFLILDLWLEISIFQYSIAMKIKRNVLCIFFTLKAYFKLRTNVEERFILPGACTLTQVTFCGWVHHWVWITDRLSVHLQTVAIVYRKDHGCLFYLCMSLHVLFCFPWLSLYLWPCVHVYIRTYLHLCTCMQVSVLVQYISLHDACVQMPAKLSCH